MTLNPNALALSATADPMRPGEGKVCQVMCVPLSLSLSITFLLIHSIFCFHFLHYVISMSSFSFSIDLFHLLYTHIHIHTLIHTYTHSPRPTMPSVSSRIRAQPWAASRTCSNREIREGVVGKGMRGWWWWW